MRQTQKRDSIDYINYRHYIWTLLFLLELCVLILRCLLRKSFVVNYTNTNV